jgi:hypothetical protein
MKKMRIRIGTDGQTSITVEGGHGSDCELFTKAVENALGHVEGREYLPEYALDDLHVSLHEQIEEREGL